MNLFDVKHKTTIERALAFTKLGVALVCSWPPRPAATKPQILIFDILWCVSFLCSISLLLPLATAVYEYSSDAVVLGEAACLSCAVAQVPFKMVICRIHRKKFQAFYYEMEDFCKHANPIEKHVLQHYVDKWKYGHVAFTCWCYLSTLSVICAPLYLPQTFPTHAKYPFSTEQQPVKTLIYIHQSFVGFQASAGMTLSAQIAVLLWYVVARFELLSMQLRAVASERDLDVCIKLHDDILRRTEDITRCVPFLLLTTIASTFFGVIFGSLNLVTDQPILLKVTFLVVVFSSSAELFVYAWPADNLLNMSETVCWAAYCSRWIDKDIAMQKKILQVMVRCQRPEAVKISGILPQLSLSYYISYLYTSFSYFTTLRVLVGSNDGVENEVSLETTVY